MTEPVPQEALKELWETLEARAAEAPPQVVARTELTDPYGEAMRLPAIDGFTHSDADYGAMWLVRSRHPEEGAGDEYELYTDRGFREAFRFAGSSLVKRLAARAQR